MNYSNVFIASPNILAQVWGLRFAGELLSVQGAGSGWNPSRAGVRHFTLQSRVEKTDELASDQKKVSILLVEDNPADAGLVRMALEEHGVEGDIFVVTDGETAIQLIGDLDAQPVDCLDLAIIDLNLPKKPGRVVLERIRRSERCKAIPVVILTSSDAEQDRADAVRLGANHYLRKPSKLEEFLDLGTVFKQILGGAPQ